MQQKTDCCDCSNYRVAVLLLAMTVGQEAGLWKKQMKEDTSAMPPNDSSPQTLRTDEEEPQQKRHPPKGGCREKQQNCDYSSFKSFLMPSILASSWARVASKSATEASGALTPK